MSSFSIIMALGLMGSLPAGKEPTTYPDRASVILRQHCARCHSKGHAAKANLHVLDHDQLVAPGRKLVVAGNPNDSDLLHLVDCGSMPPGTARKLSADE